MNKLIVLSLTISFPVSALGADLLGKAAPNLRGPASLEAGSSSAASGFYVGVNGAAGAGDISFQSLGAVANSQSALQDNRLQRSGALGGVQSGFSMQSGPLVYGVEADIDFGALRGTLNTSGMVTTPGSAPTVTPPPQTAISARADTRLDAFGALRGRIGYAFGDAMIYGAAGFAGARYDVHVAMQATGVPVTGTPTTLPAGTPIADHRYREWAFGWTLGAGGEYALSRNVSLRLEYLYAKMNSTAAKLPVTHSLNLVRTGVNYRF